MSQSDLQIEAVATSSGATAILLTGDVDLGGREAIFHAVQQACGHKGCNVIIDLSGVEFMDSTGLSALITAQRLCNNNEGQLSITGASTRVRALLSVSGADTALTIE